MVYSYEYDSAYFGPAMPVVELELGVAESEQTTLVLSALVDSGADATMIPVRYLRQIGADIVDRRQMRSSANVLYPVDIYAVSLKVGPFRHTASEVVGNRQSNDVILGRDILNHMVVTLNGLANVVELSQ